MDFQLLRACHEALHAQSVDLRLQIVGLGTPATVEMATDYARRFFGFLPTDAIDATAAEEIKDIYRRLYKEHTRRELGHAPALLASQGRLLLFHSATYDRTDPENVEGRHIAATNVQMGMNHFHGLTMVLRTALYSVFDDVEAKKRDEALKTVTKALGKISMSSLSLEEVIAFRDQVYCDIIQSSCDTAEAAMIGIQREIGMFALQAANYELLASQKGQPLEHLRKENKMHFMMRHLHVVNLLDSAEGAIQAMLDNSAAPAAPGKKHRKNDLS